jgi:alanyl-tRNA synthetase
MTKSASPANGPANTGFGIPYLTGDQIRSSFIEFFQSKAHTYVPSSPVVPHDDPTLLFINAGMNQFKSALLGENREGWKRVANSQKCIRVSGKHNDLDEVGRDTYHHTLFEMLGNWSFGDYYKKEAISWAWELLTEVWKLPKDRLFASVYKNDDEAMEIWKTRTDIPHDRILRFGDKENFWEMGDVGPCGPCSEIHFDMGDPETREATFADPVHGVNGTNARYIEIWNLVFMQFERIAGGDLKPLKNKNVDTGMGFERACSVIQGSGSNYETDVFRPLIDTIAELSGAPYDKGVAGTAHRVIADHIRALSFAIADGATPGNEGRGYVLRRILRRASKFARELGQKDPFLYKIVPALTALMGGAYPELKARQDYIAQVIRAEEERFGKTLDLGLDRFAKVADQAKAKGQGMIDGVEVFTLYDTYGFPTDLTRLLAEEQGLSIDEAGYKAHMEEQRERARGAAKFTAAIAGDEGWTILAPGLDTEFVGYDTLEAATPVLRYREEGDTILLVTARTPFYAEAGGQVGDTGTIRGEGVELNVLDTVKVFDMVVHKCALAGGLLTPDAFKKAFGTVDGRARGAAVRNHSATHLLHAALRQVLGDHVQQQGSRVAPEGLRFDFTHHSGVSAEELRRVEAIVNEKILANLAVAHSVHGIDEAKSMGAMALFGEKYGDRVRVIRMGDGENQYSMELCGGTHASATGQIGFFKITSESSIASGVRRIEAVTGAGALDLVNSRFDRLAEIGSALKARPGEEPAKVAELAQRLKGAEKELHELRLFKATQQAKVLLEEKGKTVGGFTVVVSKIDAADKDSQSAFLDAAAALLPSGVGVFTAVSGDSLSIFALVGKGAQAKVKAGDLIKELGPIADAKGGGQGSGRARGGGGVAGAGIGIGRPEVGGWKLVVGRRMEDPGIVPIDRGCFSVFPGAHQPALIFLYQLPTTNGKEQSTESIFPP